MEGTRLVLVVLKLISLKNTINKVIISYDLNQSVSVGLQIH